MPHFEMTSLINHPPSVVYAWHERPMAFTRLLPPWENVEVIAPPQAIENGSEVVTRMKVGPMKFQWVSRHCDTIVGQQFCDEQIEGPFARWKHRHRFKPHAEGTLMADEVDYELPMGRLGESLGDAYTEKKIRRLFKYRHRIVANDLKTIELYEGKRLRIAVTGASGLVGGALIPLLRSMGHEIIILARSKPLKSSLTIHSWSFRSLPLWEKWGIDSLDAVIHLAGENIAGQRWSPEVKRRLVDSRVKSTEWLVKSFNQLKNPPSVFLCASATGFYPDSSDEVVESSPGGSSFLAQLCRLWEQACEPARTMGIRTVHLRTGMVLSPRGGALKKMLLPFSLGLGGMLGHGKQYWSWISIDDLLYAIVHSLVRETVTGPVNCVSPQPLSNRDFSRQLGSYFGKRLGPTVPAFALRTLTGEMADALLLNSCRAMPQALLETGFTFRFPTLEASLEHVLGSRP